MQTITRTLIALSLTTSLAHGQLLQPVSQERRVEVTASSVAGAMDQDSDAAVGFGPFVAGVSATVMTSGTGQDAIGTATQDSSITPSRFLYSATETSTTYSQADVTSTSTASLEFQVDQNVKYEVRADYQTAEDGFFYYELLDAAGSEINSWLSLVPGVYDIEHVGQLPPGDYSIVFRTVGFGHASSAQVDAVLELSELSVNYCVAAANSAGAGAQLNATGSHSLSENAFALEASDLPPNVFGLAFYGPNQIQAPFGDGFRCVGGQTYRIQPPVQAEPTGHLTKALDFSVGPLASGSGQVLPDSDWNFQLWYRDSMGPGGTGSNTTDAVRTTFLP